MSSVVSLGTDVLLIAVKTVKAVHLACGLVFITIEEQPRGIVKVNS